MHFDIDYEITREDFSDFNKHHFMTTDLKKTIFKGAIVIILLQLFLNKDGFNLIPTLVSSIFCVLYYIFMIRWNLNKTNKIPEEGGSFLGRKQIHFSDTEISAKDADSNSTYKWSAITKLQKGKNAYYFFIDSNQAIVLPYRFFKDKMERIDFENFAEEKLKRD